jgi:hypothetical protein
MQIKGSKYTIFSSYHHSQPDLISLSSFLTSNPVPKRHLPSPVAVHCPKSTAQLCLHRQSLPPTSHRSTKCSGVATLAILSSVNFSTIFVSLRFRLRSGAFSTVVKAQHRRSNISLCLRLQMACFQRPTRLGGMLYVVGGQEQRVLEIWVRN